MASVPTGLVSHARKVCSLYKRSVRMLECFYFNRADFRYEAVLLRERFEQARNIRDARLAKKLLLDGEEELFQNSHWDKNEFPESPTGIAFQRFPDPPDGVLDLWDPIEKAQYPKYFAKREQLKDEYIKLYEKQFPPTGAKSKSK